MINTETYKEIIRELGDKVTLVAVSKMRAVNEIMTLYNEGQRDFGENYVQELVAKQAELPADIRWHFIGHLQTNKVKYITPFVYMIHSVDSLKLLKEINKQAATNERVIKCLLQVHIAQEETKYGLDEKELEDITASIPKLPHVSVCGLMGMASTTDNPDQLRMEFKELKSLFDSSGDISSPSSFSTLSMGMSGDYITAIEEGSNMVRIGSLLFGQRSAGTNG